jgi:hypothetical protein
MLVATSYVAIEIQLLSLLILKINRDLISHIIIIKQFILFYSAHTITHISVILIFIYTIHRHEFSINIIINGIARTTVAVIR